MLFPRAALPVARRSFAKETGDFRQTLLVARRLAARIERPLLTAARSADPDPLVERSARLLRLTENAGVCAIPSDPFPSISSAVIARRVARCRLEAPPARPGSSE